MTMNVMDGLSTKLMKRLKKPRKPKKKYRAVKRKRRKRRKERKREKSKFNNLILFRHQYFPQIFLFPQTRTAR